MVSIAADSDHIDPASVDTLAVQVGRSFAKAGLMITTAESCTGGGIARALTETAGSSAWFDSAFVTYSNAAKHRMLGVDESLLRQFGAVSEPVARAMALAALARSAANVAIAVTGVAGPSGGSQEKPVGTVYLAWASQLHETEEPKVVSQLRVFEGGRGEVRLRTARFALTHAADIWL